MRNNLTQEITISTILIILLIFFLNPFGLWMPNAILMMMILCLVVLFSLFAIFVWKEHSRDERESFHKMLAGRTAFLVGTALLVVGIIVQSFKHEIDPWLVITLSLMILAKVIGLIYSRIRY